MHQTHQTHSVMILVNSYRPITIETLKETVKSIGRYLEVQKKLDPINDIELANGEHGVLSLYSPPYLTRVDTYEDISESPPGAIVDYKILDTPTV